MALTRAELVKLYAGYPNNSNQTVRELMDYLFGGLVPTGGGTLTGKLTLAPSTTSAASMNVSPSLAPPSAPTNGDVWYDNKTTSPQGTGLTVFSSTPAASQSWTDGTITGTVGKLGAGAGVLEGFFLATRTNHNLNFLTNTAGGGSVVFSISKTNGYATFNPSSFAATAQLTVVSGALATTFAVRNNADNANLFQVNSNGRAAFQGQSVASFLTLAVGTTAASQMNLPVSAAPTAPVDGDVWREDNTDTGLKIRINGVTKTITVA
jgi:hypothetical protein